MKKNKTAACWKAYLIRSGIILIMIGISLFVLWNLVPEYLQVLIRNVSVLVLVELAFLMLLFYLFQTVNRPLHILLCCSSVILSLLILVIVSMRVFSLSVLFHTYFAEEEYNEMKRLPAAEEITVKTGEGSLSGWMLHQERGAAPLVLYFGGNAENSSARLLRLAHSPEELAVFDGYNFAFIDYPGYGKSDGSPSHTSLQQYGLAVYDFFASRDDVTEIIIFAFSIGTGVGNYVASRYPVKQLILFAPYADGYDLFNRYVNIFYGPLRFLVPYRMEAADYAEAVFAKPLVFASRGDEVIQFTSSERLVEHYPSGCRFITLENVRHNDIWNTPSVLREIKEYLSPVK